MHVLSHSARKGAKPINEVNALEHEWMRSQTHHQLKQQLIQKTNGLYTARLSLFGEVLGLDTQRVF